MPRANYGAIKDVCTSVRIALRMRPADATLAILAIDRDSDRQQRFIDVLHKVDVLPEAIDFRWTYANPSLARGEKDDRPISTLGPHISYTLGLMAGRAEVQGVKAEVVLFCGIFDVAHSLLDFCQNRGGRAVVVFPRSLLDHRWAWVGLGNAACPIEFVDFEPEFSKVFGIPFPSGWKKGGASGLAGI